MTRADRYTAIEAVVHEICRYIEARADASLPLAALAKRSGYSATHLQRRFTAIVGSSPKAYQSAIRTRQLKRGLKLKRRLDEAIHDAGYGSPSRVYEKLATSFGMTPKQYRDGGRRVQIHYATCATRLGRMLIGATARGICLLQFADAGTKLVEALRAEFPNAELIPMPKTRDREFAAWMRSLDAYLVGQSDKLDLPLDIRGTAFQVLVWNYLQTIPSGTTQSYGAVAKAIGRPAAVRAVASACARNKIALTIPCHRVIRGTGELGGYRWTLDRKRALLELERKTDSKK